MARSRALRLLVPLAVGAAVLAACSSSSNKSASTTGTTSSGGVTVPSGTAGKTVSVTLGDTKGTDAPMTMTLSSASTSAGDVSFNVKNAGTIEHEMVILKTDTQFDQLPVSFGGDPPSSVASGGDKVDEATKVGETGDPNLKPGESRTFTVKGLAPGHYVFVCNIAKHYGLGMRAAFTVS